MTTTQKLGLPYSFSKCNCNMLSQQDLKWCRSTVFVSKYPGKALRGISCNNLEGKKPLEQEKVYW